MARVLKALRARARARVFPEREGVMDTPVTNVTMVCSEDKVPEGYTVVSNGLLAKLEVWSCVSCEVLLYIDYHLSVWP